MTGYAGDQRGLAVWGRAVISRKMFMLFSARPIRATTACEKRSDYAKHMPSDWWTGMPRGVRAARCAEALATGSMLMRARVGHFRLRQRVTDCLCKVRFLLEGLPVSRGTRMTAVGARAA